MRESDRWVSALHASKEYEYVCWCPDRHRVCLRQPSGKEGVRQVTPHLAHVPVRDGSGELITSCRGGGESEEKVREREGERKVRK